MLEVFVFNPPLKNLEIPEEHRHWTHTEAVVHDSEPENEELTYWRVSSHRSGDLLTTSAGALTYEEFKNYQARGLMESSVVVREAHRLVLGGNTEPLIDQTIEPLQRPAIRRVSTQ